MCTNNRRIRNIVIAMILVSTLGISSTLGSEGSGSVRLGYTYVDETGSFAVNQETYNTYEGVGLSLSDFTYSLDNGVGFRANLQNITLNNRSLTASASKPGLFGITLRNSQYRRNYNYEGTLFARRRNSSVSFSVRPARGLELVAGYRIVDRKGTSSDILGETTDLTPIDYRHKTANLGASFVHKRGSMQLHYRRYDYDSNIDELSNSDRQADQLRVTAAIRVPRKDWIMLSGGLFHRIDKLDGNTNKLESNLGWGGTKLYLPDNMIIDYRLAFARTKQSRLDQETDNVTNTISVGKSWNGLYGFRVGYENRIADDLVDRTESDGLLLSSWYNYDRKLFFRASVALRNNDVVTGSTLIGDESITTHKVVAKYVDRKWGDISLQWNGKIRKHEPDLGIRDTLTNRDINSRVSYNSLTGTLNLKSRDLGKIRLSHSYYLGKYENNSTDNSYEFSDHIFSASVYPKEYANIRFSASGTYYRSLRKQNMEKFRMSFTAEYALFSDHVFGATYQVFNFDDFTVRSQYYTANIVDIYVTKGLKF